MVTEATANDELRAHFLAKGIKFDKSAKGNKLLALLYTRVLGDTQNLIAPFFYLYELRNWAAHDMGDDPMLEVAKKLGVANSNDYQTFFERLLDELRKSAEALQALV